MTVRVLAFIRRILLREGLALILPALLLIGLLYLVPVLQLAAISFGEQERSLAAYADLFGVWSYGGILLRTTFVSASVVIGCILFGYPIGYVLAFSSPRLRACLSLLVLLPFWTSVLVRNFSWIYLLRDGGALSMIVGFLALRGADAQLLYNDGGVVIAMVSTLLPFMIFPTFLAIFNQDSTLREAAASLGASPARVFFTVTLPLSTRGIFAGSLLVFATALGFFITPAVLGGGRVVTSATFIRQQIEEFVDWPLAAAAAMVLLAIVLAVSALYLRVARGRATDGGHAIH
jgi:ABC-type spermidine/putrescine transport system permease subunit I